MAPGFEVLDEAEAQTLLRHAQDEQMEALARADAPADLVDALASVAGRISIAEYAELMTRLLGERAWLLARIGDEAGPATPARAAGARAGLLARRHGGRADERCLSRHGVRLRAACTRPHAPWPGAARPTSRARALIADWLADGGGRDRSLLAALPRGVLHRQGRDPARRLATKAAIAGHARHRGRAARRGRAAGAVLDRISGAALVERTHGAAAARPRHRRALRPRQAAARRARLRRPDRRHAPAAGERRQRRLGALQARRRHRPRAGRRGAGHQPRPVGGDPPPDRGVLRRRGRGRARAARCSRSATPSSRSSASSAPTRASSRRCASGSPSAVRIAEQELRAGRPQRLLPLDAGGARCGRLGVRRGRGRARPRRAGRRDPPAQPQGRARPGRALAAGQRRGRRDRHDRPRGAAAARWRRRTSGWRG